MRVIAHPTRRAVLAVSFVLLACDATKRKESDEHTKSAGLPPGVTLHGEALGKSPEVSLSAVLKQPQKYEGQTVRTAGTVRKACSAKGCWMELAESTDKNAAGCRVTFKDYGFFVPKDSAGSTAVLEGLVQLKRVKKSHVDHYEGEGATFAQKNEDGSANEVRLVATGVQLKR